MALPKIQTTKSILARYIGSSQGRATMAAKMTPSLRRFRDYSAVGRKAFIVDDIEDGALPVYDKDPMVPAYMVAQNGDSIIQQVEGERVFAPMAEIASYPTVKLTEIAERRYDIIKRSVELGVSAIKEVEDVFVFGTIDALAADTDNIHADISVAAPLGADVIADAQAAVEEHGLRVARMFMNARDYADIKKFDRDVIDQETQGELFRTGVVGTIYGMQVILSRVITPGVVYLTGEREFYGHMPVRRELTILTADDPKARQVGFSMFEQLGCLAYNFLASQRILVTRS